MRKALHATRRLTFEELADAFADEDDRRALLGDNARAPFDIGV
jgi:hypothetical protein